MNLGESLTAGQAARVLGISRERIIQLTSAGKITAVMTPLGRLYDAIEVNRVLAERKRKG